MDPPGPAAAPVDPAAAPAPAPAPAPALAASLDDARRRLEAGDVAGAGQAVRTALAGRVDAAAAGLVARLLAAQGRRDAVGAVLDELPADAEPATRLDAGWAALAIGRPRLALAQARAALAAGAPQGEAALVVGEALLALRRPRAAARILDRVAAGDGPRADLLRARAWRRAHDPARAVEAMRAALAAGAPLAGGAGGLAALLFDLGTPAALREAARLADEDATRRPLDHRPLAQLADIRAALGDGAGQGEALDRALALRRSTGVGSADLLFALLRAGRLADAVPDLLFRWSVAGAPPRPFSLPAWSGGPGGVLVWGEQGVGEEIWAAALVARLAVGGRPVVLECAPRLAALFRRSFPAVAVVARTDPPDPATAGPALAAQAAAVDLLAHAGPGAPGAHPPYLVPDPALVGTLRRRYRALGPGPVIGLSWRSANRRAPGAKSVPLDEWGPVLAHPGAVFVDLQYGDTGAERDAAARRFAVQIHRDPAIDPLGDLDPVAAQVAAMDRVVTVSNTTAHLAGAVGTPAAVLLHRGRGLVWSWLDGRTAWYRSALPLLQARPGSWNAPLHAAAAWLADEVRAA